jgi:hypothetical protein
MLFWKRKSDAGGGAGPLKTDAKPLIELTDLLDRLVRTRLWVKIVVGMVLGVAVGMLLSPEGGRLVPPRLPESSPDGSRCRGRSG